MGLFGGSPQKKLEKARTLLGQGRHYDALLLFREIARASVRLSPGEISEIEEGSRRCRGHMISLRLRESEELRLVGDLEGARDLCRTALDLAQDDLPTDEIREQARKIDAPRRPSSASGRIDDAVETDLLPETGRIAGPAARPERSPAERPAKTDEELFGDDPEALFEVYLHTFDPETAELYRSLGDDFHRGYLALVGGEGKRALDFFDRVDWSKVRDPRPSLDRAHALLLAGRGEDALALLDSLEIPEASDPAIREARARRQYLRIEVLRAQGRYDEAVQAAAELAGSPSENVATESLLAWTLLEAGRPQETYERLKSWIESGTAPEEIMVPGAQAAVALGEVEEAIQWLASLIERRLQRSVMHGTEVEFPVEAGRRLLDLYVQEERESREIRSLALHLLDHDEEHAEEYRQLLLTLEG